jgi:alkylation response protein AidB-like acyl-CoA dehydrogenase
LDFAEDPAVSAFGEEVSGVLAAHMTPALMERVEQSGTHHDWDLHRDMAARGWLAAALPEELGGTGRSAEHLARFFRELELASAPYDGAANAMLVGFTLGHLGTDWQRAQVLAPMLDGSAIPCLGYTEPESGSDVAAAATKATRAGDGWVISGQKMFTSLAEEARWAFMLTRTNADVAKHRGLTFFLVPMASAGVSITPVRTITGKRTNITYYDDVRVGDEWRVGEINGGWEVMLVALAFERGIAGGVSDISALYADALTWAETTKTPAGGSRLREPKVRTRLARAAIDREVAGLLGSRAAWAASEGVPGQEGAEAKLFGTEAYARAANDFVDMLGSDGLLTGAAEGAPVGGRLELAHRYAPILTTAGGTSEIQKNLIAERTLGLPRRR